MSKGFRTATNQYLYQEAPTGQSWAIGLNNSLNNMVISSSTVPGADLTSNPFLNLNINTRQTTLPKQPTFTAVINAEDNVSGDNTVHTIGSVTATTELHDPSSNFFPGDGAGSGAVFTAPIAGLYMLGCIYYSEIDPTSGGDNQLWSINTTSYVYRVVNFPTPADFAGFSGDNGQNIYTSMVYAQMDALDTAEFLFVSGPSGSKVDDVAGGFIYGCLLF